MEKAEEVLPVAASKRTRINFNDEVSIASVPISILDNDKIQLEENSDRTSDTSGEMTLEERVSETLTHASSFDKMWEKFQNDFDNALGGIVGDIGASINLYSEDPEKVNEEDRFEVLGGIPSIEAIATGLKEGRYKNVIIMTGAGLSTAAGIPDFRSPEKGLYATLKVTFPELNNPTDIFTLSYFKENPQPFWKLCRELDLCGNGNQKFKATKAHYLSQLLSLKGILKRTYTQNIDGLDLQTGLSPEMLIESHGGGRTASCMDCDTAQDINWIGKVINEGVVPRCKNCSGLCKPDITFFGESLPKRFAELKEDDFSECDLLIVMGTSLQVAPFCNLVTDVGRLVPRLVINLSDLDTSSLLFKHEKNYRDVFIKDTCDAGVQRLVDLCEWENDFLELLEAKKPETRSKKCGRKMKST